MTDLNTFHDPDGPWGEGYYWRAGNKVIGPFDNQFDAREDLVEFLQERRAGYRGVTE